MHVCYTGGVRNRHRKIRATELERSTECEVDHKLAILTKGMVKLKMYLRVAAYDQSMQLVQLEY